MKRAGLERSLSAASYVTRTGCGGVKYSQQRRTEEEEEEGGGGGEKETSAVINSLPQRRCGR